MSESGSLLFYVLQKGELEMNKLQNLKAYSLFSTKRELNKSIYTHIDSNRLNKTDKRLFELISRYSIKYIGVAYLKVSTMADSLNVSTRTIKRSLARLETLSIIKRVNTFRKVFGGYGANIIQILPFKIQVSHRNQPKVSPCPNESKADEIKPESMKNEKETTSFKASKDLINTYYTQFKNRINSYINDSKLTSKLYGIYLAQTRQILKFESMSIYKDQLEQLALQAITITLQATKRIKINNLAGYYNNTLSKLIDKVIYADLYHSDIMPDFQNQLI